MFAKNKDEQLVCSVSGHRSTAVRAYKHIPDSLRRSASECIQGEIVQNETNAPVMAKGNDKNVCEI